MAYQVGKRVEIKRITKGEGFDIEKTKATSPNFSINYLSLNNSRDPSEPDKVGQINEGYSAIYIHKEGSLTFILYEDGKKKAVQLQEGEYIYLTPGTLFEINGTGKIILIALPAYSEEMYSHPRKPQ